MKHPTIQAVMMDSNNIIKAVFALVFVVSLIGIMAIFMRKMLQGKNLLKPGKERRMKLEEVLYLDNKRRLVIVKKDDREITILIGLSGETVINN